VAERARQHDAMYKTIGIKVVTPPFEQQTRRRTLSGPVDDPELVEKVALELLEEFRGKEVRKLGVMVSNLTYAEQDQARLGSWGDNEDDGNQSDLTGVGTDVDTSGGSKQEAEGQSSLTDFN